MRISDWSSDVCSSDLNLEIPAENLIGEEGKGFKYILDGLNAERALIAAECIGDGHWFIDKVTAYTKERIVFNRPIGQNQGVQFPIARAHINIEAASLMRFRSEEHTSELQSILRITYAVLC